VHTERDTYSSLEAAAVAYAYAKGAVVVAAVGNGDEAFSQPWPYASYPAALPHVIGVSALTRSGNVPDFSNRDPVFNDISAPGAGIYSTLPLALTAMRPTCPDQGFSDCGDYDYRNGEGTSFAAPQVSAAAAVLFALDPLLTASQAAAILEHTADDVNATTGCVKCLPLHDPYSGWGRLDIARAIAVLTTGPLPAPDRYEENDNAGTDAHTVWGKHATIGATLDYYDDPVDVYRVALGPHERLAAKVSAAWPGARVSLTLWKPGTQRVDTARSRSLRAVQSAAPTATQRIAYTSKGRGWYYVEVHVSTPSTYGPYTLTLSKTITRR
jgi:subtilisin family serine protease